ncbi:MAG: hypothetical protein AAF497_10660 [Planctomycetota bacterium]
MVKKAQSQTSTSISRRNFVAGSVGMLAATAGASAIAQETATEAAPAKKAAGKEVIIGKGDYQFRVDHQFCQLPEKFSWQTTHNVAVDSSNNLYVIHEGRTNMKDHPSIFVFSPEGKFIRAFGSQFQGGGHGIEIRKEGSDEFLYVAAYQDVKSFAKMTLKGETVWYKKAPMESGVYAEGEDVSTKKNWSRKGFLPTNFTFLDNGGFLLVDGYGSYYIHEFDKDAKWVRCFGGAGKGEGKFNLAHGIWVDDRPGRDKSLYVTDRSHNTVQILDMDGNHIETMRDYGLPANIETRGNLMLIPELKARITLLDEKNNIVARLDDGLERLGQIEGLRTKPDQWKDGQFVHPHDACFDQEDNLFVAEWVQTGRVTKLTRVS